MRKPLIFLVASAIIGTAWAQAPASVADTVWLGFTEVGGQSYTTFLWYKSDGSFEQIFAKNTDLGVPNYNAPISGTYQYAGSSSLQSYNATLIIQPSAMDSYTEYLSFANPSTVVPEDFGQYGYRVLHRVPLIGGSNSSVNAFVTPGHPATLGFVVSGSSTLVLLRVVGPSLQSFGVAQPLPLPSVALYSGGQQLAPAIYNDIAGPWRPDGLQVMGSNTAGYRIVFNMVGAFPLTPGAGDWSEIELLPPGAYTLVATAPTGTQGQVLCEVYFLPYAQ